MGERGELFSFLRMETCHKTAPGQYKSMRTSMFIGWFRMLFMGDLRGSCGGMCQDLCNAKQCNGFDVPADGSSCTCKALLCDGNAICAGNSMCQCNQGYEGNGLICSPITVLTCSSNQGCMRTLDSFANVTFPAAAFTEDTVVSVKTTTDPKINNMFIESAAIFRPGIRLGYEVQVITERPPTTSAQVELNLPPDFIAMVKPGDGIEVFVLIKALQGSEGNYVVQFDLIEDQVVYNQSREVISFNLPKHAFVESVNGSFVAAITLAPTPGGGILTRHRQLADGACGGASIRCPLPADDIGCFVLHQFDKEGTFGIVRTGVEYEAPIGTNVLAASDGTILYSGSRGEIYGTHVILAHTDGSTTVYARLNEAIAKKDDVVKAGDKIGLSGGAMRMFPFPQFETYLHFEYAPTGLFVEDPYLPKSRINPDPCIVTAKVTKGQISWGTIKTW